MPDLDSALRDLGGLDELARRRTRVHRLDARAKVIVALAFAATVVSFGKYEISGLLPLLAYPVTMVALGELPARYLLRKMLYVAPFALALGIANPLLDRAIVLEVGSVRISGGWISLGSMMLRFGLTFCAALILISTTGFDAVCMALRRFKAPRALTMQLMLMYRYLFVLAGEASRMMRAWSLRSIGARRISPGVFGSLIGHLLLRALDRAQRLHAAMLCRGFDGEIGRSRSMTWCWADAGFTFGWIAFFLVTRLYDLPQLMGRTMMGFWP